jgi:uncharacterized Fe-S cluster-containing protein
VALVDALRDIATEEEVMKVTSVSLRKLRNEVIAFQDKIEGEAFKIVEKLKSKGIDLSF